MDQNIVIGSGPAGVSAAVALIDGGKKVLMLDGGVQIESHRRELVERMRSQSPDKWAQADLAAIKQGMDCGLEGIPLKRLYGSDFPYRDVEKFVDLKREGVDMTMSLAFAGLSNVWGSAVLPFAKDDFDDWPIDLDELEPYYRRVFSFVPLSAVRDDLAELLPLYSDDCAPLKLSRQAEAFLADLVAARDRLERKGIVFGRSRLAVQAVARGDKPDCAYCGLCLYGCPYDLIYSTAHTLKELQSNPNFSYVGDVIVDRVEESPDCVIVLGRHRLTGEQITFAGGRAFLACGVIGTTKILLESLEAYDKPVVMRDSQYFLVPLLRARGVANVDKEQLHTLTQLCIEIRDPAISARGIHLSVYTHSELFGSVVRKALGPASKLTPLLQALLGRILVIGGYLHSDDSSSIEVTLLPGSNLVGARRMMMKAVENPRTSLVVRKVLRKLVFSAWDFKGMPAFPAVRVGMAGRGYHAGGTFPMSVSPGAFECDVLGRPSGFRRLHIADATCFPSIPATNITLTVMAHAYRLAELCGEV